MSSLKRSVIVSFRLNRDVHRIAGKKNPDAKAGIGEFVVGVGGGYKKTGAGAG
jgi:hypothetical protein